MTNKEAWEIMDKEYKCLSRQSESLCSFDCENCDLVRTIPDVLEAQRVALLLLGVREEHIHKFRETIDGNAPS